MKRTKIMTLCQYQKLCKYLINIMYDKGLNYTSLCDRALIEYTLIYRYFNKDEDCISLESICKIAGAMDQNITIRANKDITIYDEVTGKGVTIKHD